MDNPNMKDKSNNEKKQVFFIYNLYSIYLNII